MAAVNCLTDAFVLLGTVAVVGGLSGTGIAWALLTFVTLRSLGTQFPRISPRLSDDVGVLLAGVAVPLMVFAPVLGSLAEAGRMVTVGLVAALVLLPARGLAYAVLRTARARGGIREPTLILGAGKLGCSVAETMRSHPEYGLVPVGFLDDVDEGNLPLPLLGDVSDFESVVREQGIQRVIVAFGRAQEPEMVQVLRASDDLAVEVYVIPRLFELGVSERGPLKDELWGIPLIRLRRSALNTVAWRTKRVFDLVVGSLALIVTAPLFLAAAAGVRLSGPGRVFFRQKRIGQRGRVIDILKFRTLRENKDSDTTWTVDGDDRVTWFGRILRRTSIDELPQLLNVLRGDMSLIGPRPERPFFVARYADDVARYRDRHRVPVGITGWAQVHGLRGDTSISQRVRFDNYYIEHWSLWTDLVITVRTIWHLVTGRH